MPDARKGEHVTINVTKDFRGKKGVGLTEQLVHVGEGDPKNLNTRTVAWFRISPSLQNKENHTPSTPAVRHSNLDAHS
jgi:hypothetical protein